jgi:hypothetical protein
LQVVVEVARELQTQLQELWAVLAVALLEQAQMQTLTLRHLEFHTLEHHLLETVE